MLTHRQTYKLSQKLSVVRVFQMQKEIEADFFAPPFQILSIKIIELKILVLMETVRWFLKINRKFLYDTEKDRIVNFAIKFCFLAEPLEYSKHSMLKDFCFECLLNLVLVFLPEYVKNFSLMFPLVLANFQPSHNRFDTEFKNFDFVFLSNAVL